MKRQFSLICHFERFPSPVISSACEKSNKSIYFQAVQNVKNLLCLPHVNMQ